MKIFKEEFNIQKINTGRRFYHSANNGFKQQYSPGNLFNKTFFTFDCYILKLLSIRRTFIPISVVLAKNETSSTDAFGDYG